MSKRTDTLYCFSPPVMIATFIFEVSVALYTVIRYRMNGITRLIGLILVFLALFQFAEYNVCEQTSLSAEHWSRIGYMAITMLPILGLHLIFRIAGTTWRWLQAIAYMSGAVFALVFGLSNLGFAGYECTGNYVIFQLGPPLGGLFFLFYHTLLIVGIMMCWHFAKTADTKTSKALMLQSIGYLVFMVPTGIVNAINPETMEGLPSIMCGFAVLYAAILVVGVLPLVGKKK